MASSRSSAELAGAHPGAGQQLDDEPAPPVGFGGQGGHELGGGRVVEELRERLVGLGEVAGEHRDPARGVGVVPVDDPLEEACAASRGCGGSSRWSPSCCRGGPGGPPARACRTRRGDARSPPPTCTSGRSESRGRRTGATPATPRRPSRVATTRPAGPGRRSWSPPSAGPARRCSSQLRSGTGRRRQRAARPVAVDVAARGGGRAHRGIPTDAWASMASAARRYSSASQSSTEMQIQLGGGDRAVTGLGLQRLDATCRASRSRVRQVWRSS